VAGSHPCGECSRRCNSDRHAWRNGLSCVFYGDWHGDSDGDSDSNNDRYGDCNGDSYGDCDCNGHIYFRRVATVPKWMDALVRRNMLQVCLLL